MSAQQVEFTGLKQDNLFPIQITSDVLSINQSTGVAIFEGKVIVTQGDMTINAAKARIENKTDGTGIDKIFFSGHVTFHNLTEAAEVGEAVYTVDQSKVVMTGNVRLTQGKTTIAGRKLVYDLQKGIGQMQGPVHTTFLPRSSNTP
ncbi:MAG: lipopolysaccharide transport periplasmic protein LptA [Rhodobacteraceae bacterium]|nr:lipopolysaccharide transport periplasmic protein LptA [Paracoccaceae bacterium]